MGTFVHVSNVSWWHNFHFKTDGIHEMIFRRLSANK